MPTENTSLKTTTPAADSNTTHEIFVGKRNTYQRTCLIVAGSLLAMLVLIAGTSKSSRQHLQSSAHVVAEGALAVIDYQLDSTNLALTMDIFDFCSFSENDKGKKSNRIKKFVSRSFISF